MYRILIVEDDSTIASLIEKGFCEWGYTAKRVTDFQRVTAEFSEFSPHIVLMDISLPFRNGYMWCTEIRRISKVPVVFVSSASDNMNIVMAMNMGGDDFIAKPFDMNVLLAKVQAILRRTYDFAGSAEILGHGGVTLSLADGSVCFNDNKQSLSKNEFYILRVLMENVGKTVGRDTLMQRLWETDLFVDENTLSVNVARLRKRLSEIGVDGFITTRKGEGYIIL